MDLLNRAFTQLKELYLSLPPSSRIIALLLLGTFVVGLAFLFTYQATTPEAYLLGGEVFSTSQLTAMEAAFAQEGLSGYEIVAGRVRVPKGRQSEYLAALAKHNALPANFGEILDRAIDKGSPFEPRDRREARLKNARQVLLSEIISSLKGVERATVVYDEHEQGGLNRQKVYSAAVVVKPQGGQPLDPQLTESIRMLVVAAIAGLKPENVAVTDANTGQTTFGESGTYGSALNDPYFVRKRMYEKQLRDDILRALSMIPGVIVTTNVELDPEQIRREQRIQHDPKAVEFQSSESTRTRTRQSSATGGRPGYVAQQGANTPLRLTGGGTQPMTEQEEETERQSMAALSGQLITSEKLGLIPKRVSVAITVPSSYFEKIWLERNPVEPGQQPRKPTPAELSAIRDEAIQNIKKLVAAVLPKPEGVTDPTELVTVTDFPDLPPPEIPQPSFVTLTLDWLQTNWQTLAGLGLLGFSILVLRSLAKGGVPQPAPTIQELVGAPQIPIGDESEEEEEDEAVARQLKRFQKSGASLRDELSMLVSEDPEAAANILRNWIGAAVNKK